MNEEVQHVQKMTIKSTQKLWLFQTKNKNPTNKNTYLFGSKDVSGSMYQVT